MAATAAGRAPCGRHSPCHADGVVSPRGGARVDHKKRKKSGRKKATPARATHLLYQTTSAYTLPPRRLPHYTHGLHITQLTRSICDANDCRLKPIRVLTSCRADALTYLFCLLSVYCEAESALKGPGKYGDNAKYEKPLRPSPIVLVKQRNCVAFS